MGPGVHVYNYVDKPDLDMNSLVSLVRRELSRGEGTGIRIPARIGLAGGRILDILSRLTGTELPVSAIHVKKFTATTQFASTAHSLPTFHPPVSIHQALRRTIAYEFLRNTDEHDIVFYSE